jgi:hypothetical protein
LTTGWRLRSGAFADVPDDKPADLADLYQLLAEGGRLAAHEIHQRFFEIGSFEGLQQTREYLADWPDRRGATNDLAISICERLRMSRGASTAGDRKRRRHPR